MAGDWDVESEEWEVEEEAPSSKNGLPETVRRARALAAGVSSVVTGPGQIVTSIAEGVSGKPGLVKNYTEGVKALETQIAGQPLEGEYATGAKAASLVAGALVPGATLKKAATLGKAALQGAKAGAMGSAFNLDTEATDKWDVYLNTALGTTVGAVLGGVAGAPKALRNAITSVFRKPPNQETVSQLAELMNSKYFKDLQLSAGQSTGSVGAALQEARVAGDTALDFYNKQAQDWVSRFKRMAGDITNGKAPRRASIISKDLTSSYYETLQRMQARASKDFGAALDGVTAKAMQAGNPPIPIKNFIYEVASARADIGTTAWEQTLSSLGPKERKILDEALALHAQAEKAGGSLVASTADVVNIHRAAATLQGKLKPDPSDNTAVALAKSRLGRSLRGALDADVAAASEAVPEAAEALNGLAQARSGYKAAIDAQNEMRASSLATLFGSRPPVDPEDAIRKIMNRELPEQRAMVATIAERHPELLAEMKAWKLKDAMERSIRPERANTAPIDTDKLLDNLTNNGRLSGAGFWTAEEAKHLKSGVAALRLIQDKARLLNRGVQPEMGVAAAVSMSTPFLAKFLYTLRITPRLEKIMFTPEGIRNLQIASTVTDKPTNAAIGALAWLTEEMASGGE